MPLKFAHIFKLGHYEKYIYINILTIQTNIMVILPLSLAIGKIICTLCVHYSKISKLLFIL